MISPRTYPPAAEVAGRILALVDVELRPAFAAALARSTSAAHNLDVTDDEVAVVTQQLPGEAAGQPVGRLDVIVAELIARYRSQATAARSYRDTLAAFGSRAPTGAAPGAAVPASAATSAGRSGGPPAPPGGAPAVPLGDLGGTEPTTCSTPVEMCAVSATVLGIPVVDDLGELSSDEAVMAAAVLAVVYLYGDGTGFLRAIDTAIEQLDSDELCIVDDDDLLDDLGCWSEIHDRIGKPERARLVAKVLGLRDPDLPDGVAVDPTVQGLLDELLDAVTANCDPGWHRDEPTSADRGALERAIRSVRSRLTSAVSTYSIMRIKQLQVQFAQATDILDRLAPHVRGRCLVGSGTSGSPKWISVSALQGDRAPDGTDLVTAAARADAWRIVFDRLAVPRDGVPDEELCQAAALLRPRRSGCRCRESAQLSSS